MGGGGVGWGSKKGNSMVWCLFVVPVFKMDPKFNVRIKSDVSWKRFCSDLGPIWEPKLARFRAICDACFRLVLDLVLDTVFDLLQGHVPGQVGGKKRTKTMEGLQFSRFWAFSVGTSSKCPWGAVLEPFSAPRWTQNRSQGASRTYSENDSPK